MGKEPFFQQREREAIDLPAGLDHFHTTEYQIACAYAAMNKTDLAIEWLQKSAPEGFNATPCSNATSSSPP